MRKNGIRCFKSFKAKASKEKISMSFFQYLVMVIVAGVGLWLIHMYIPVNDTVMKIINIFVVIFVWGSSVFFVLDAISGL